MPNSFSFRQTVTLATVLVAGGPVWAQTGVSDDRVSLPDGPGSLDGMGDNASVTGNMGLFSYGVDIRVPQGFASVTPSLRLSYSSGSGGSVVGIGWSLPTPFIERMTAKGLPAYGADDDFVANGGSELVRVDAGEPAVYRERLEGSFVRYTWHQRGSGAEGYWVAQYPDGSKGYFGADRDGQLDETARVRSPEGVFRYLLVDKVDVFDHRMTWSYKVYGSVSLPDRIAWVYRGGTPVNTVRFAYEAREDRISDARGGFNELTAHRLTGVEVFVETTRLRRYALAYEPYAAAGGMSRLARVTEFGLDDEKSPVELTFGYSRALGGVCDGTECEAPYLVDLGRLGVNVAAGTATLVDLNGDALPDVVDSSQSGQPHRIFLNRMAADGTQSFAAPVPSAVGNAGGHDLSSPYVQELDVDGDGFTDLMNAQTGEVLMNEGTGSWARVAPLGGSGGANLPDFGTDFELDGDAQLAHVRFFDYDGDRRIDVLKSDQEGTQIFRNLPAGGFEAVAGVQPIGAGFATDDLDLADMNGDGLLDPVIVKAGLVRYRLNLGRGKWAAWTEIAGAPVTEAELDFASLEDMNGDGIDDLVVVIGNEVRYALNRNGTVFDDVQKLTAAGGKSFPVRDESMTVLFADMNANCSNDVVWVDATGGITFLELFPVRPNLLSHVENGLGLVADVTYGTAVQHMARDQSRVSWPDPVVAPSLVVNDLDSFTLAANPADVVHHLVSYAYEGGYYDGLEKQFRGFARVIARAEGDEHQQGGTTTTVYDTGATDPYRNGLRLSVATAGDEESFDEVSYTWADCPLEGVPSGTSPAVRNICMTEEKRVVKEGRPESEWVTTRATFEQDAWGDVTLESKLGVTAVGGGACAACNRSTGLMGAPCGPQCTGDESFTETAFIAPTPEHWIAGRATDRWRYGVPGSAYRSHTRLFYDGEPFVGLPAGQLTRGLATRVQARTSPDAETYVDQARNRFDDDGNVVETINPNAPVEGRAGHTFNTWDTDGLLLTRTEVPVTADRSLAQDFVYDAVLGLPTRTTGWYLVGGARPTGTATSRTAYDAFGRPVWDAHPGDAESAPSVAYSYELASPVSRVTVETRSKRGAEPDRRSVVCTDGAGRRLQLRVRQPDGTWEVSGATVFNRRGQPVRRYDTYGSTEDSCTAPVPSGTAWSEYAYDAAGRGVRATLPSTRPGGEASVTSIYLPLVSIHTSPADDASAGGALAAPQRVEVDGLGRRLRTAELDADGATLRVQTFGYDELGRLASWDDPKGNHKRQTHDLLGRVLTVEEPDAGLTTFTHDAAGNVVQRTDASGKAVSFEWDALGRQTASWDPASPDTTRVEYYFDRHPTCPADVCTNGAALLVGSSYPLGELGRGVDSLGYDDRGSPVLYAREIGGQWLALETEYDNTGAVTLQRFPGGREVRYEYDSNGRLSDIPGLVSAFAYDGEGRLESYRFANGVTTRHEYDLQGALTRTSARGNADAQVLELGFERDRLSRVVEVTGEAGQAATYAYDVFKRVVSAKYGTGDELRYSYDDLDNLVGYTALVGGSTTESSRTYGAGGRPHALESAGAATFEYDGAGRATKHAGLTLTRDHLGRVVAAASAGGVVTESSYDASGRRVVRREEGGTTLYVARGFEIRDGISRIRVSAGEVPLVELESAELAASLLSDLAPATKAGTTLTPQPDGAITAADAWLAQAVASGAATLAAGKTASPSRALLRSAARRMLLTDGSTTTFLHVDHLGSTVAVSDAAGTVTERLAYDPFGTVRSSSAGRTEEASFTGKAYDATGLIDFGVRTYDPKLGRWLEPDPAFVALGEHTFSHPADAIGAYSYVGNDGINRLDRDGRELVTMLACGIAGAVIGGGANALESWGKWRVIQAQFEANPGAFERPEELAKFQDLKEGFFREALQSAALEAGKAGIKAAVNPFSLIDTGLGAVNAIRAFDEADAIITGRAPSELIAAAADVAAVVGTGAKLVLSVVDGVSAVEGAISGVEKAANGIASVVDASPPDLASTLFTAVEQTGDAVHKIQKAAKSLQAVASAGADFNDSVAAAHGHLKRTRSLSSAGQAHHP